MWAPPASRSVNRGHPWTLGLEAQFSPIATVLPPVWGAGDKIEEGWYDSVGFIKSHTQTEWKFAGMAPGALS